MVASPRAFELVAHAPSYAPTAAELHSLVLPISPSTLDQQLRLPVVAILTETAFSEGRPIGPIDILTTDGERFDLRHVRRTLFQRMGLAHGRRKSPVGACLPRSGRLSTTSRA